MSSLGYMPLWMSQTPVLIAKTFATGTVVSNVTVTTSAIDTTGAKNIFLVVTDFSAATQTTPTDNKGNTYTRDVTVTSGTNTNRVAIYRCFNATVGTGHTFTYTTATASYPTLFACTFNSKSLSLGSTSSSGLGTAGTTIQPGAITTPVNGGLIIAGVVGNVAATVSINSNFTLANSVSFSINQNFTGGMGYLYQRNKISLNPTWTYSVSQNTRATVIASYQ